MAVNLHEVNPVIVTGLQVFLFDPHLSSTSLSTDALWRACFSSAADKSGQAVWVPQSEKGIFNRLELRCAKCQQIQATYPS